MPGTEKVFERIAESFELAKPPARKTTTQTTTTATRCRSTNRVQPGPCTEPSAPRRGTRLSRVDARAAATSRPRSSLHEEIEELFSELWQVPRFAGLRRGFRPNVDSYHTDDPHELTVIVEVPGIDPKSLDDRRQRARRS